MSITPVPLGSSVILPFELVEDMVFVSMVILSITALVNEPAAGVVAPIIVSSIVPRFISALDITTEPVPFGVRLIAPSVFVLVISLPFILILSISRSPVTFAEPVIVSVAVSIVTALDAFTSTVGAKISS